VLGGRGIQDVLCEAGAAPEQFGTTLRTYDQSAGVWHITWTSPAAGEFANQVGRAEGDRIVQIGPGARPGSLKRWTFSEITRDSFRRQGETSEDEGHTRRLAQEMRATRDSRPSPSHLPSAQQGAPQGEFVGVVEIPAYR
jgi:hypothetical protein